MTKYKLYCGDRHIATITNTDKLNDALREYGEIYAEEGGQIDIFTEDDEWVSSEIISPPIG